MHTCFISVFIHVLYLYVYKFYFLLIETLIKPYDKNDIQHINDNAHGIIDIIIINKGDISINEFSSVQLHIIIIIYNFCYIHL